jgi:hypothetical protein
MLKRLSDHTKEALAKKTSAEWSVSLDHHILLAKINHNCEPEIIKSWCSFQQMYVENTEAGAAS